MLIYFSKVRHLNICSQGFLCSDPNATLHGLCVHGQVIQPRWPSGTLTERGMGQNECISVLHIIPVNIILKL